ncbi:beta-galactosidase [Clostridium hydrogenum]|uniref:beta-galactosidase n=1 Tax=Clostridium hydrogenum TaxID=2855764 RepID=UPI001F3A792F|nr:beta-galactosidase [Clostridium hydrogenum]
MDKILYGTAYYYEYLPYERLEEDISMMKKANINLVRIGESTWSTYEPQDGVFDFSPLDKVLDAMNKANISVIVGTPTYAIPTWLARKYPEVMVTTKDGQRKYGARQIMDITNQVFLKYAERIIKKMISHVANHPAIIGYQIDNETKHYGTSGENVQKQFAMYIKAKFSGNLDKFNKEFGLDYWSNRINSLDDFLSVDGTINGSLGAEFEKFQREIVTNYLNWQAKLVRELKKENQFITHNLDFEWRGYSYGIQPDVNHFEASKCLDITGIDVYHPSQENFTGAEISFAGDIARTTKHKNYFVLETQAQAFKDRVPFPGQLKLAAYSHIASGANVIEYWHWHSIHNSLETYWKGILSHDFNTNPVYEEVSETGKELKMLSKKIANLKISSKVAFLVSNESLTALKWFPFSSDKNYNDVFRILYDELYKLNVRTDVSDANNINLKDYDLVIIPSLYSVSDKKLEEINEYVKNGGHILCMFKSGFTNENVKVRTEVQPGILSKVCGVHYEMFVDPKYSSLDLNPNFNQNVDKKISDWMELLIPDTANVLAKYKHKHWGKYAAITENIYGNGSAIYIGCLPSKEVINEVFKYYLDKLQILRDTSLLFPIIYKEALNAENHKIRFYFNYSDDDQFIISQYDMVDLLTQNSIKAGDKIKLSSWNYLITEEK